MVPARYMARIADGVLAEALTTSGAVQVKGPKWCGKTATSLQQAASVVYLQDPDRSASYLALADAKPSALLEGRTPGSSMSGRWRRSCGTLSASPSTFAGSRGSSFSPARQHPPSAGRIPASGGSPPWSCGP